MKKRLAKTIITIALVTLALSALFAASVSDTAVLRLTAYIPERTTFSSTQDGFSVASNSYNFTYQVIESGLDRTLVVVAN